MEFYFVFEGLDFSTHYSELKEAINYEILGKITELKALFANLSKDANKLAQRLALSSRSLKGLKDPRFRRAFNELKSAGIIKVEKSLETKPTPLFGEKLRREIRRHLISDKAHFSKNFYRFYFAFIAPKIEQISKFSAKDKEQFLSVLQLERFFCLPFELVCADFLSHKLGVLRSSISSYWDKDCEIDILVQSGSFCLAAEVKYKEHIVSKKLLNELVAKCEKVGIKPDFYALFSKSGFSGELINLAKKSPNLLLFELNDFKDIL